MAKGLGREFERGVGQYPTVGDEVHLVTTDDLKTIYGGSKGPAGGLSVGHIASASGISADISIAGLVTRHSAVVGSTGAGKSNLVTVLLETISDGLLPNARTIVIDPHGEYAGALGERARVFRIGADEQAGERELCVPYWALPFSELQELALGGLNTGQEAAVRDHVLGVKLSGATHLKTPPPEGTLTADSPVPFSVKRLWYELDRFERITFSEHGNKQSDATANEPEKIGSAEELRSDRFPAASPYNQAPYKNQSKRNIERQLDLMRSRLRDARFAFLFSPHGGYEPSLDGKVEHDLDDLVAEWVGHDKPITIFDVSGVPSEVLATIVGDDAARGL